MSSRHRFSILGPSLGCIASLALALPSQAQPSPPAAQCYSQALSYGAPAAARHRAAYLCAGATSTASAQCYWQALSFGADDRTKARAARLCRGATDLSPAQCDQNTRSFGAGPDQRRQALNDCMAQPPLTIPIPIQDCALTTARQLHVSPSSALNACSQEFYQR
jgi:hypothetical protein